MPDKKEVVMRIVAVGAVVILVVLVLLAVCGFLTLYKAFIAEDEPETEESNA